MNDDIYISTSAGIIKKKSVSFVQTSRNGLIQIFMIGREEPICLLGQEAIEFVKLFEPIITIRQD